MPAEILTVRRPDPEWGASGIGDPGDSAFTWETLTELPIFQTLTPAEIRIVDRIVHRRSFATGEVVLRAWRPRSGFYVIEQGLCRVMRRDPDGDTERVVGELGPGDLLGEFSLLDDSPRTRSIVAAEPSVLLGFFRPDLVDLVTTEPKTGFKILLQLSKSMGKELRSDIRRLRQLRKRLRIRDDESHDPVHPAVT